MFFASSNVAGRESLAVTQPITKPHGVEPTDLLSWMVRRRTGARINAPPILHLLSRGIVWVIDELLKLTDRDFPIAHEEVLGHFDG